MGRPPVTPESQLSEIIQFRLTPLERQRCEEAAARVPMKLSAWIRRSLLRALRGKARGQ